MPKALCIMGIVVAAILLVQFLLDLALWRATITLDIIFILGALVLGYLSWSTLKEQG